MRTALVILLVASTAIPMAIADTCVGVSAGTTPSTGDARPETPGDVVALWSQIQDFSLDWTTRSSEHRTSDGYLCESADDFYCESGDTIVRVDWWGHERDLPGGEGVPEITEFIIRFCEDDTTTAIGYDVPGAILYEEHVFDFTSEYLGIIEKYYYTCELPVGFDTSPGETYWISILAVHAFPSGNQQWYWFSCIPENEWGAEATYKSEFWGAPEWIPWSSRPGAVPFDHAFILYSRGDTPVEDTSWGAIKALYRQ